MSNEKRPVGRVVTIPKAKWDEAYAQGIMVCPECSGGMRLLDAKTKPPKPEYHCAVCNISVPLFKRLAV